VTSLTRAQLVSRSAKGGATLLVGGSALGRFVEAAAADPLPGSDLAYARLLVGAELLAADFYAQAVAAANTHPTVAKYLKRAEANEQEHYKSVAGIISGAGQTPAVAGDIDFSYPRGSFKSEGSVAKVALELETVMLGAYLGAVEGIQTAALTPVVARIAASEAQHVAYLSTIKGLSSFQAFPNPMTIQQVSNALDVYTA